MSLLCELRGDDTAALLVFGRVIQGEKKGAKNEKGLDALLVM